MSTTSSKIGEFRLITLIFTARIHHVYAKTGSIRERPFSPSLFFATQAFQFLLRFALSGSLPCANLALQRSVGSDFQMTLGRHDDSWHASD